LKTTLKNYITKLNIIFPSLSTNWVRNPYSESSAQPANLTLGKQEELCKLQADHTLMMRFTDLPLDKFCFSVKEEYPAIHRKAIHIVAVFDFLHM
jgi:hypothetical protein